MNIAICDNDRYNAQQLLYRIKGARAHTLFPSAEQFLFALEGNVHFDLYLLDIFIGDANGIELGKRIRGIDSEALICFISSSRSFYAETFSIYAFQYLTKPVSQEAFQELLHKASERLSRDRERSITLACRCKTVIVPYGCVMYITGLSHTLYIYCIDGAVEQHTGRLDDLESQLDPTIFVRCHQSYIVNLYHVTSLDRDSFLIGNKYIPISRRYASIKKYYWSMLFEDLD